MTSSENKKAYMREYAKKRRAKAIEQKLCPSCMKSDERTENGYTYCAKCAERYLSYYKDENKHEDIKAKRREYAKKRRAWAKENHICTRCMKKDERTLNGMAYCAECAAIYRAYAKKKGGNNE